MHRFFELISVGEEIIQEAKPKGKSGFLASLNRAGMATRNAAGDAAGSAGRGLATVGKKVAPFAGKAGSKFIKKHPKKFGAGALALGAAGVGGAGYGGAKLKRKFESDIEEGIGSTLAGWGKSALGATKRFGGQVGRDYSTLGKLGKLGMKGKKGGIFNAASLMGKSKAGKRSLMRGGLGIAGVGAAGYAGNRAFGNRYESELPELSANLQDQFLTKLTEGKAGLFKKAGGTVTRAAGLVKDTATSGFKYTRKKAGVGIKWGKKNPGKVGLAALGIGGVGGFATGRKTK